MIKKIKTVGVFIVAVIVVANPIASLLTYLFIEDKLNKKG